MGRRLTKWSSGDRCHSGGFLLRIMPPSWQPVPACASNGHSAGGPFNTATTGFRRRNYSSLRQRKLESDASPLRQKLLQAGHSSLRQRKFESDTASMRLRLLQAGHSTCRHDGTAVILDFRPRIGNRCSKEVKTRAILALIPDFKPRLENRCSQKLKTGAIRASILDFKPRLENRCKVFPD